MKLILRGKRIGFSLDDIRELLGLYGSNTDQSSQIQLLITKVSHRINQLQKQKDDIDMTLDELKEIQSIALETLKNKPKN
jgi:DNA-binding transcriptional MerR regulator